MSAFDKLVVRWVNDASESVPVNQKESILGHINNNLLAYERIERIGKASATSAAAAAAAPDACHDGENDRVRAGAQMGAPSRRLLSSGAPLAPGKQAVAQPTGRHASRARGCPAVPSTASASVAVSNHSVHLAGWKGIDYDFWKQLQCAMRNLREGAKRPGPDPGNGIPDRRPSKPEPLQLDAMEMQWDAKEELLAMAKFTFGPSPSPSDSDNRRSSQSDLDRLSETEHSRWLEVQTRRSSRPGVSDMSFNLGVARNMTFPSSPKSGKMLNVIQRTLEGHFLFSFLDAPEIAKFASIMVINHFPQGSEITVQGRTSDTFFLVLEGEVEATVPKGGGTEKLCLGRGATLGDVALMYDAPSEVTSIALSDVRCASLKRQTYKAITATAMETKRECYTPLLEKVELLSDLPRYELEHLAELLKDEQYTEGEKVITVGTPGDWLYFIAEGVLSVTIPQADGTERCIRSLHRGDVAGHLELLFHHLNLANLVVTSPTARVVKLSRGQFDRLLESVHDAFLDNVRHDEGFDAYRQFMAGASAPGVDPRPLFDGRMCFSPSTLQKHEDPLDGLHRDQPRESSPIDAASATPRGNAGPAATL